MTDTTPTPGTFDLEDWITGGTAHRLRKHVTVYREADLLAQVDQIDEQLKHTEKGPEDMQSMGDTDPRADLEQRRTDLITRLEASRADVEVFTLIDSETAAIRKRLGGDEKPKDYDWSDDQGYTYELIAAAATLNGHQLTADQWERVHETIGVQFNRIVAAYVASAQADITPRFRR